MSHLFSPIKLREVVFRNRIGVSPMCQYSSQNGFATDWHLVHLGSRAAGGAGLVMMEATAVSPEGRITPGCTGIWDDRHVDKLRQITEFIHSQGAVAGIQLAHAGRKASRSLPWTGDEELKPIDGGWEITGPSAFSFGDTYQLPKVLTVGQIEQLVNDFGAATERALASGFKLVEIHAAHGYLLHSFLSPLSNQRPDSYGGTFENRTRFLKEVIKRVRGVWPEGIA